MSEKSEARFRYIKREPRDVWHEKMQKAPFRRSFKNDRLLAEFGLNPYGGKQGDVACLLTMRVAGVGTNAAHARMSMLLELKKLEAALMKEMLVDKEGLRELKKQYPDFRMG